MVFSYTTVARIKKSLKLFKQTSSFDASVKWLECIYLQACSLSNDNYEGLQKALSEMFLYIWWVWSLLQLCFLWLYRCFLLSPVNSCLVSRTPAGMRNTLGISLRIHTGQTCMHAIRGASGRCFSTWGTRSENTCFIATENSTACGAFLISISLANQSVAQRTCTTDWGCTLTSSSPLSKSHTGGPARGLVSKENYNLLW